MQAGAVLIAFAAAIGNLLQGWDNATIAGVCVCVFSLSSICYVFLFNLFTATHHSV